MIKLQLFNENTDRKLEEVAHVSANCSWRLLPDTQLVDVPGTGWASNVERQQLKPRNIHDRCVLHMWSHDGYKALGLKQMKRFLMAAFIKFTKQGGRHRRGGGTEEKQVAGPVLSLMKTDIVEHRLKRVAAVEGFMEICLPWTHRLPVPESFSNRPESGKSSERKMKAVAELAAL